MALTRGDDDVSMSDYQSIYRHKSKQRIIVMLNYHKINKSETQTDRIRAVNEPSADP